MKIVVSALAVSAIAVAVGPRAVPVAVAATPAAQSCPAYLNQDFRKLGSSQKMNICKDFAGKPLLIVNTASHCGFTPQFKGLESIYQKYKARGLVVVGFASDDFNQEDQDEAKAAEICQQNFGVTFTMLSPQHVRGAEANPVFKELAKQTSEPKWNFNKYLVAADGKVAKYFPSNVAPESAEFNSEIEKLLN